MDPSTASAGAAALGAGLDFMGGLFGSKASKNESRNNRREARRQFNEQMDFQKNYTQYRINDAIKAGVNPLAALGMNGGSVSPTISTGYGSDVGSQISNTFSRIGDRIQRAVESFNREAAMEGVELDLENKRLHNQLLQARLDSMTQPGHVNPDVVSISDIASHPDSYSLSDLGSKKPDPLLKRWRLPDGSVVRLIDSDAVPDTDFTNVEGDRALAYAAPFYANTYKSPARSVRESRARDYYSWRNVTKRYFGGR